MLRKINMLCVFAGPVIFVSQLHSAAGPRGNMRAEIYKNERVKLYLNIPSYEFRVVGHEDKGEFREFASRTADAGRSTHTVSLKKGSIASGLSRAIVADIKKCGTVLEETEEPNAGYTITTLIAKRVVNGRPELVAVRFYAGPANFGGFQYVVSLNAFSEQDALAKIRSFLANNVSIV